MPEVGNLEWSLTAGFYGAEGSRKGCQVIENMVDVTGIEPVPPCLQNRFRPSVKLVASYRF